ARRRPLDAVALRTVAPRLVRRQLTAVRRPIVLVVAGLVVRLQDPQIDVGVVAVPGDADAQVAARRGVFHRLQAFAEEVGQLALRPAAADGVLHHAGV